MLRGSQNRAPRRKLIPNLFSNILKVIAESDRPLTQHEIVEAVSQRMERSDEELKRQITVNLHDALITGYLRVKNFRYSIVPNGLDPNEPRESRNRQLTLTEVMNVQNANEDATQATTSAEAEQAAEVAAVASLQAETEIASNEDEAVEIPESRETVNPSMDIEEEEKPQ
ncbi:uncharacterized protein LOC115629531 [Scaptodrosophila lebanonensis]|uniref:Uncharacterized protein LOC115629531 n=1 Tax=Drosophila lebanonensis TaxID=7225 RepID=A0A6J2U412_DROLE|nr:uncharacterized protein LOC115629531 [Scaptodrosophila lebanonensis]